MYRKAILVFFAVLVAASAIFALIDRKKLTTTSDKAYEAYLRGEEFQKKLYVLEAAQEYERAVQADPRFSMAYARLAWLYKDLGREDDYKQAKARAFEFIDKVTDFERIQINLGFSRIELVNEDVEKYSRELLDKYRDSIESYIYLSGLYWGRGAIDSALEANLRILEIDPQYALAYNMLGYIYYKKGEYDKALENINKYSTVAVDQANPHDSYGEILLWLGRYDEALRQFQIADSIKPNLDFVVYHMAETYGAKGMYRDAMGAYLKARELALSDNRRLEFGVGIAGSYIFSDRYEEAIEILNEIVKKRNDSIGPHLYLGVIHAWQGRMDDALVELGIIKGISARAGEEASRDRFDKIQLYHDQIILEAEIASARKEYDKAISLYRGLLNEIQLPARTRISQLLGDVYIKAGKADSAVFTITEALEDNPNFPRCLKTLADAYKALGRAPDQREALARLLSVYKDADEDFPPYILALAEMKRLDDAAL